MKQNVACGQTFTLMKPRHTISHKRPRSLSAEEKLGISHKLPNIISNKPSEQEKRGKVHVPTHNTPILSSVKVILDS